MSKEGSRSKRPTLTDVAKLVGVSPSKVSRVPCPISPEVQRRVLEAVEKLGYRPYPIAQAFSTRRTYIVGLVLLSPTQLIHPYTAAIVQGALEVAHQRGYHITLIPTEQWWGTLPRDTRILTMMDGVIITTRRSVLPDDLAWVHQQVPVVLVQFRFPNNAMPSVHADYRLADQLISDHLRGRSVRQVSILLAHGILGVLNS